MREGISGYLVNIFPILSNPVLELPLWYWLSAALAFLVAFIIAIVLRGPITYLLALILRQRDLNKRLFIDSMRNPINLLTTVIFFIFFSSFIKDPTPDSNSESIIIRLSFSLCVTYFFYKIIDLAFSKLIRANLEPRSRGALVLPLVRRVAKIGLLVLSFLFILSQLGVDVSAFLVGLGVGGLAIALAAQKILENLFGGAVLSLDQPFKVGDYCKCGDVSGCIEEIGIRSTRIRTIDRTLISIPNSKLSEMQIENYAEREKRRLYVIWHIDLATGIDALKSLLSEFERIFLADDNFYHDQYRFRLIGVNDLGFEIEIFAYSKSVEISEFSVIKENLFFAYIDKMASMDINFAVPPRKQL